MKKFISHKKEFVTSVALALTLAGSSPMQATSTIARSQLGAKVVNKAATWAAIALLFVPISAANVQAYNIEIPPAPIEQAIQVRSPKSKEHPVSLHMPLYDAITKLNHIQLKESLEAGKIDVNARDEDGNTALHILVLDVRNYRLKDYHNRLQQFELVLAHGIDLAAKNNVGKTALAYLYDFTASGRVEYSRILVNPYLAMLVKATYGINGKDERGITALEYALQWGAGGYGNLRLARQLVAEGADMHVVGKVYNILPKFYQLDEGVRKLNTAAMLVTDKQKFISVAEEHDIDLVAKRHGKHLLEISAIWGNKAMAETLVDDHGIDPSFGVMEGSYVSNSYTNDTDDSLMVVGDNDPNNEVLKALIVRGANVNSIRARGIAPLHVAAESGKTSTVEILLKHGANPNAIDKMSKGTILHYATARPVEYSFDMVSMLLARGAEVADDDKDFWGKTVYEYATSWDSMFSTYAPDPVPSRYGKRLAAATAALVLQAIVGTEGKDEWGKTPMDWAKLSGSETIQKVVANEIGITQLFEQELRQQVKQEIRQTDHPPKSL